MMQAKAQARPEARDFSFLFFFSSSSSVYLSLLRGQNSLRAACQAALQLLGAVQNLWKLAMLGNNV